MNAPADIRHIFVLMLENRSFDHMFALSGIPGIHAATSANSNTFDNIKYDFGGGAPEVMPSDPLHGFCDVLTQVAGEGADCCKTTPYPPRTDSGFVANYATTKVRGTFGFKHPLPASDRGKIMLGVDTPVQTPALYTLATQYALCDSWYSSLPGPTWPNRFFVHGASSDGQADAPSLADIAKWEFFRGFRYPNGSIYDALGDGNFRLYQDKRGPLSGLIPQVSSLKGISFFDVRNLDHFAHDLAHGYSASYTFIEPAYGDVVFDTYRHGSSQHPMDGLAPGDRLVARVYHAIRNSPLWKHSLLIITYDEHGGFYDCGDPPQPAPPPGDGSGPDPDHDFDFSVYGVRVPAVLVSPWIAKGKVDHTLYDHASVLATVERLFNLPPLTDRDAGAQDVCHLLTGPPRADKDCPEELPEAPPPAAASGEEEPARAPPEEPIPDPSNLRAFLYALNKTHREVAGDAVALARFEDVQTRGQADDYINALMPELDAMREGGLATT